jgi:hypothetical protein
MTGVDKRASALKPFHRSSHFPRTHKRWALLMTSLHCKRFTRQKESLPQLESGVSADEQARLLNNPPISFRNSAQGTPAEKK